MAKKKATKVEKFVPAAKVAYRCNKCGKVNDDKNCCTGDDYTKQLI